MERCGVTLARHALNRPHLLQRGLCVVVGLLERGQQAGQLRVAKPAGSAAARGPKPVLPQQLIAASLAVAPRCSGCAGAGVAGAASRAGGDAQARGRRAQRAGPAGRGPQGRAGGRGACRLRGGQRVAHKQAARVLTRHKDAAAAVGGCAAAAPVDAASRRRPRRLRLRRRQKVCRRAAHAGGAHAAPRAHAHPGAGGDGARRDEGGGAGRAAGQQARRALRQAHLVLGGGRDLQGRTGGQRVVGRGMWAASWRGEAAGVGALAGCQHQDSKGAVDGQALLHSIYKGAAPPGSHPHLGRLWQHAVRAGGHTGRLQRLRGHQGARGCRRLALRGCKGERRRRLASPKQAGACGAKSCRQVPEKGEGEAVVGSQACNAHTIGQLCAPSWAAGCLARPASAARRHSPGALDAPNRLVLDAPNAGVDAAPKAGVLAAPNPNPVAGFCSAGRGRHGEAIFGSRHAIFWVFEHQGSEEAQALPTRPCFTAHLLRGAKQAGAAGRAKRRRTGGTKQAGAGGGAKGGG